jgi:hypothetical protein
LRHLAQQRASLGRSILREPSGFEVVQRGTPSPSDSEHFYPVRHFDPAPMRERLKRAQLGPRPHAARHSIRRPCASLATFVR